MAITSAQFSMRVNGVTVAPFVSITGGVTGQFESANSSSTAGSDEDNYKIETFGTVGQLVLEHLGCLFTNSEAASSIKTFNGLFRAGVKTVNGLSLWNVKTWNGLA